jgi:hypothetical protein
MSGGGLKAVGSALDAARPAPRVGKGRKEEEHQLELPFVPAGCPIKPLRQAAADLFLSRRAGPAYCPRPARPRQDPYPVAVRQARRPGPRILAAAQRQGRRQDRRAQGHRLDAGKGGRDPADRLRPGRAVRSARQRARPRRLARDPGRAHHPPRRQDLHRSASAPGFSWRDPDLIDGFVYPTAPAMPRPDRRPRRRQRRRRAPLAAPLLVLGAAQD